MKCCKREVYAVQAGDYVGQMFTVVEPGKDFVGCLSLPLVENIKVPRESFENGRNNDIIKFVERLPKRVYSVVEAQYRKNEDPDNRRQQLNTPNVSHSEVGSEDDRVYGLPSK
jgi:hypothetical protein